MAEVEQLAGMDAAFLYMETPTQHMHVCGTMILQLRGAETVAARKAAVKKLTDLVLRRIASLPAFRRRIVETPLGLSHPAWADVPHFRARDHLHHATVERSGGSEQLAAVVARIAGEQLDRGQPLWELWVVDGLEEARIALVLKVHHAVVDGVAALSVLGRLFTTEEGAEPPGLGAPGRKRKPLPTTVELALAVLRAAAETPGRAAATLRRTGQALLRLAGQSVSLITTRERPAMLFATPRTCFNRALTAERAVAFGRVDLERVKAVKNAFEVTVNDVVLAACTRAIGDYLRERGELPNRPLVATVPVSEHGMEGGPASSNLVSAMFIGLPVQEEDPRAVMRSIHEQTLGAKKVYASFGPYMLAEWVEMAPPPMFAAAVGAYSRWRLADHVPPAHSVVISNVPGPPVPLYAGEARLIAAYPFGPILEGAAVNITVVSYDGSVDVGVITCPRAVRRPHDLTDGFERAIGDFAELAADLAQPSRASRPGSRQ